MKNKKAFIAFTVIFAIVAALAIFFTIWYWGDTYPDFSDKIFREEVEIPGLEDGATPQGIATYKADYEKENTEGDATTVKQDYLLISAYMQDGPSRIYVTGKTSGYIGYVTLKNTDGSDYKGHCGGVATNGRFLWVSSDDTVFVAKTSGNAYANIFTEIITKAAADTETDKSITFTDSFRANCNASFLYYYDSDGGSGTPSSSDRLYVGEVYRGGNYETNEKHHIVNPDKTEHRAFAYEYYVNSNTTADNTTGLRCIPADQLSEDSGAVPKIQKIFSIPEEIQGFARTTENALVLSQSYGLKNSRLYYYDWEKVIASENRKTYKSLTESDFYYDGVKTKNNAPATDANIPDHNTLYVYYVYGDLNKKESPYVRGYDIPSMSEGLCVANGRVHVLFESASKKYRLFVRQQISSIYSFIPSNR